MTEYVGSTAGISEDLGVPGMNGGVFWDGSQYIVVGEEAPSPEMQAQQDEEGANAPMSPSPDLNALTAGEDENLRTVLSGINGAVQARTVKLAPEQQAALDRLISDTKHGKDWPGQVHSLFNHLKQNNVLNPILKTTGLDKKNPQATKFARHFANRKAPQKKQTTSPQKAKNNAWQVRGLTGSDGGTSATKKTVYISAKARAATSIRRENLDVDNSEVAENPNTTPVTAHKADYPSLSNEAANSAPVNDVAAEAKEKAEAEAKAQTDADEAQANQKKTQQKRRYLAPSALLTPRPKGMGDQPN